MISIFSESNISIKFKIIPGGLLESLSSLLMVGGQDTPNVSYNECVCTVF